MAAVATSSGMGASVVGHKAVMPATKTTSQWDTKRHIAFSHVAHLGVDSVLFALRLRAGSMDAEAAAAAAAPRKTGTAAEQEDPAARGRRNRERERAKRDAKRKGAAALAAGAAEARLGGASGAAGGATAAGAAGGPTANGTTTFEQGTQCKNKSCVRRGTMEEKLEATWEQVTEELGTKIKGVQKLRQSVDEVEKRRDAALEEITSLKVAGDARAAWAGQRKQSLQASEVEERRILEESQRLEVELRKLRTRYQEETQQRLPMPHGSIISEADAWARAAEASSSSRWAAPLLGDGGGGAEGEEEDDGQPPSQPQPFVSDGLTVTFFRQTHHEGARRSQQQRAGGWSEGLKRHPGREHSGRFGRWGTEEAREQWSCCLWEEADAPSSCGGGGGEQHRNGGDFDADPRPSCSGDNSGGGPGGRRRRAGGGVAGGCEVVPPHPDPGGMTTADDVRLVWRGSEHDFSGDGDGSRSGSGRGAPRVRHEAWGADGGGKGTGDSGDDRELWRPILATRMSGGGGGAAWSLIGHGRRPQTANARMVGRRPVATTATATAADRGINGSAPEPKHSSSVIGSGGGGGERGGGCSPAPLGAVRSSGGDGCRRRPGSAPSPTTHASRQRQHHRRHHPHNNNHAVKGPSPLMNLRSARTKAGWQRQRPTPVGTTTRGLLRSSLRTTHRGNNRGGGGGGTQCDLARKNSGGGVDGRRQQRTRVCGEPSLRSRSLTSLNAAGSTYSVYSKGEGRGAGATAAAAPTLRSDRGRGAPRA